MLCAVWEPTARSRVRAHCHVVTPQLARARQVLRADGYIFCAPENLASVSGEMKEFFDRCARAAPPVSTRLLWKTHAGHALCTLPYS